MSRPIPTIERLHEILSYDPDTGILTWKINSGRAVIGKEAGSLNPQSYRVIRIDGHPQTSHRMAWAMFYGEHIKPPHQIDHINRVRNDNRIVNLRAALFCENQQNKTLPKNKTGYTGVYWSKRKRVFWASIKAYGKNIHLGQFATAEAGHLAYLEAKQKYHPFQPTLDPTTGGKDG